MTKHQLKMLADAGLGIKHDGIVLVKEGITGAEALEKFVKMLTKDTRQRERNSIYHPHKQGKK